MKNLGSVTKFKVNIAGCIETPFTCCLRTNSINEFIISLLCHPLESLFNHNTDSKF